MDYPLYLAHLGLPCDIVQTAPDKHLDIEEIERAWTTQTRALILSQPASPTGILHTRSELTALAKVLHRLGSQAGRPVILIADEAHSGHVWADVPFPAPAAFYPDTITIRSVSKTWDMQGQRTGYLAVSEHFTAICQAAARLEQQMRISGQCAPTALMQRLAAELADAAPDHTALADLQRSARRDLQRTGIHTVAAEATRFIYARAPIPDAAAFVSALADRGVLVMPSTLFHEPGWFRLSLNVPYTHLRHALAVIGEVAHDA
jgi:aspartate aminotransferase